MGTFLQARRRHECVRAAAQQNADFAADLWNAVVGVGADPAAGSHAEAVRDTVPAEHAALLATDDVAAAHAFGLHWQAAPDPNGSPFEHRSAARSTWETFDQKAKQARSLAEGFGWDLSAAWTQARDVELARGDMQAIERIARLAGRMYVALRGARAARVHGVPSEVYSVEQGNDLGRLLPAEQVPLTEGLLEMVVLERIATRRAAQYAVRGTERVSKGPLVVALDESSSMHADRNTWAKAAAVALSRVAAGEKRPMSVVHYSTSTVVQALRPGDAEAVVQMIGHFLGGGTAIGLALRVALDVVRDLAKKGDKGADILLVTDGVDGDVDAQEAAVGEAMKLGVRLWTVAIECDIDESSPLREKAARYVRLGGPDLDDGKTINLLTGAT